MVETELSEALAAECRILTRYLIDGDAQPEVLAAYQRAHAVSRVAAGDALGPLDRALLHVAHLGPGFARAADGYAAAFARTSLLRRKLVLLVAILESRRQTAAILDTALPGSRVAWMLAIGLRVVGSVLMAGLATLLIAPLCVWYRVIDARGAA